LPRSKELAAADVPELAPVASAEPDMTAALVSRLVASLGWLSRWVALPRSVLPANMIDISTIAHLVEFT